MLPRVNNNPKRIEAVKILEQQGESDVLFGCDFCLPQDFRECSFQYNTDCADGSCAMETAPMVSGGKVA